MIDADNGPGLREISISGLDRIEGESCRFRGFLVRYECMTRVCKLAEFRANQFFFFSCV